MHAKSSKSHIPNPKPNNPNPAEWDEGEVCMHAVDTGGASSCELGSPVYNASGELIALVVKQSRTGGVRKPSQILYPLA